MCFAVFAFRRKPSFNIVFFDLAQAEVSSAIQNYVVRNFQRLHYFLGIFYELLMPLNRFLMVRFAQNYLLNFKKFMHAENTFCVFAVAPGFAPVAWRERG